MKRFIWIILLTGLLALLPALAPAEGSVWFCPNCGQENNWNFCSNCGTKKPDTLLCPSCGAQWKEDLGYRFCPDCGAKLILSYARSGAVAPVSPAPAAVTAAPRPTAVSTAAPAPVSLQSKTYTVSGLNARTAETIFQAGLAGAEKIVLELNDAEWTQFSGNTVDYFMGAAGLRGTYYTRAGARTVTFGEDEDAFYPGFRILAASRTGTEDRLPARYRQTLTAARSLISGVTGTALDQYAEIHDRLARKVVYTIDDSSEEDDCAIGALVSGKANCDGYADAYLLCCGLKGLDVRYIHGYSREKTDDLKEEEGGHLWNLILLDGTWRSTDVTWDDQEEQGILYEYFNIGLDRMRQSYLLNESLLPSSVTAVTPLTERPVPEYAVNTESDITQTVRKASQSRVSRYVLRCSDQLFSAYLADSGTFWRAFTRAGGEDCDVVYRETRKTITVTAPAFSANWAYCETEEQLAGALKGQPKSMMIACSDALFRAYEKDSGIFWRAFARAGGDSAETTYSTAGRRIQFTAAVYYTDWSWCATADDITSRVSSRKNRTSRSFALVLEKSLYQRLLGSDDSHAELALLMARGGLTDAQYSYRNSSCTVELKSYEWYDAWIASVQTQSGMTDAIREARRKGWSTIDLWLSEDLYRRMASDKDLLVSTIRGAGINSSISWTTWENLHRILLTVE